jgi:hypothetical protein
MLSVALDGRFRSSEDVLAAPALPAAIFAGLREALKSGPVTVADDAEQGRALAVANCRVGRAEAGFACPTAFNQAMAAAHAVNRRLARLAVVRRRP